MKTESYQDLIVYQKAYYLTLEIYRITKSFPAHELYGIVSQMRRAAVSIPCNISEGYRRGHQKEYIQFLNIARGSCGELETLLSLSKDLNFLSDDEYSSIHTIQDEISRMLSHFILSMSRTKERS